MKHGILMMAHSNPVTVSECFRLLDDERFSFYLLVDTKSKYQPSDFIPDLKHSKVKVLDGISMNWGGYSAILGELALIEAAALDGCEYLHYLQGADLPLKSPDEIDEYFTEKYEEKKANFMNLNPKPTEFARYKVLCKHFFVDSPKYRPSKWRKKLDHCIACLYKPFVSKKEKFHQGSALFSITKEFADYVLGKKEEIKKKYKNTLCADEVFLNTLLFESEFCDTLEYDRTRFVNWGRQHDAVPYTFIDDDKDALTKAFSEKDTMFARKFADTASENMIKYVAKTLGDKK